MKGDGMPDEELEQKLLAYFEAEEAELEVPAGLERRLAGLWGAQERRRSPYWGRLPAGGVRPYPAAAVLLLAVVSMSAWALLTFGGNGPVAQVEPGPEHAVMVQVWETPAPPAPPTPSPEGMAAGDGAESPSGFRATSPVAAGWRRGPVLRSEVSGVTVRVTPQVVVNEGHYGTVFYVAQGPSEVAGWKLSPQEVRVTGGQGREHPVRESKALATVGPLTLGVVSFGLADPQPGVLTVTIDDFNATSARGKPRRIDGAWTLKPLERGDHAGPSRVLFAVRSLAEMCVVAGEAGIGAHRGVACPPLEPSASPAAPASTPIPAPAASAQLGTAGTPTPAPMAASSPALTAAPSPTATPSPRWFSFASEGAGVPIPAPTPAPPASKLLTFKLYDPEAWYLDVVVSQEGLVSVAHLRPATNEKP